MSADAGGLLDIELHPGFQMNRWIYLSYVVDENGERLRVSRARWTGSGFEAPDVVFVGVVESGKTKDLDGRIRFGTDGKLYVAHGDFKDMTASRDLTHLRGKTLRLNDDGSVPGDNPFLGKASGARSEIFRAGAAPFHEAPLSSAPVCRTQVICAAH
jgi:glucose/arabinose dehydrogenase